MCGPKIRYEKLEGQLILKMQELFVFRGSGGMVLLLSAFPTMEKVN